MKARIFKSHQKDFECQVLDTKEFIKARAKGNLLKGSDNLVVGDIVHVAKNENEHIHEYVIDELCPRSNEIFRIIVRESKKKVTASNCDYLIIVMSVSRPLFK